MRSILLDTFEHIFSFQVGTLNEAMEENGSISEWDYIAALSGSYQTANEIAETGYLRTAFSSFLVNEFVEGVQFEYDRKNPSQSKVFLIEGIREKVEILKRFTYVSLITSPRLAAAKFRGKDIVTEIFTRLSDSEGEGHHLLPSDFREWYERVPGKDKNRVICDFIAGMTDRYAVEFFFRLKSENPATIFKPL